MSEEIPPSSLVSRPESSAADRSATARYTLRLNTARWAAVPLGPPTKAAVTVIGAWLVLAWNRFGFQGLGQPRVMIRFVLIGVYGWLGLVAVTWLVLWLRSRRMAGGPLWGSGEAQRLLQVFGLSHLSLLVLAITIQIGQAIPVPLIVPGLTIFVLLIWFPGMLIAAVAQTQKTRSRLGVAAAVFSYLFWLGTVGRYLVDQLGHLI